MYNIIYADPPWFYNNRRLTRKDNPQKKTRYGIGAAGRYPLMRTQDICDLPVENLAADNCALFLWATFPRLPAALKVMESWGFEYKTTGFVWVKLNPGRAELENIEQLEYFTWTHDLMDCAAFFGVGYYTKSNPELCLLGTRGKMKPVSNKISNLVFHKRLGHSAKPPVVRRKIEKLFGDVPRIELFARESTRGWDTVGYDIDGRDIRDVLCSG